MYLEIRDYRKIIGGNLLFSNVNISMERGEIITLAGDSGAGKSTFLRMLAGIESKNEGSFSLDGVQMDSLPKGKRPLSIMFQEATLFPHLNVIDNVCLPLKFKGVNKKDRYVRAFELLGKLGLSELKDRYSFELSGGQKQRVSLARAIISSPKLLLLDEPFASLDLKLGRDIRGWMKNIIRENGITTVFVTHNQEDALVMSSRIFIIDNAEIKEGSKNTIDKFFGEGVYINDRFVPMDELEITMDGGLPIEITGEIMVHGESFVVFKLEGREKIIKKPDNLSGDSFFIGQRQNVDKHI